jgi:hypothetical protein
MDLLEFHGGFGFKETKVGCAAVPATCHDPALSRVTSSLSYMASLLTWARDKWGTVMDTAV